MAEIQQLPDNKSNFHHVTPSASQEADELTDGSECSNDPQAMSVSSTEDIDSPILDDYCNYHTDEQTDNIGENLDDKDSNDSNLMMVNQNILQEEHETDEEFSKRKRKVNYLSLAQEFAALKKVDNNLSPYDMHFVNGKDSKEYVSKQECTNSQSKTTNPPPTKLDNEVRKTTIVAAASTQDVHPSKKPPNKSCPPPSGIGEFDIYNIETAMPQLNWELLEEQLNRAAEDEHNKELCHNYREEIRRKLAMSGTEEESEQVLPKKNLQSRLQSANNLQICFMKQPLSEAVDENPRDKMLPEIQKPTHSKPKDKPVTDDLTENISGEGIGHDTKKFLMKRADLQAEARMALAQVRPMAHMQLLVEKEKKKKSPISEIVPGLIERKKSFKSRSKFEQMNIAQLQVVVNDLHGQIASNNEELVKMLVERDDLHMAQDSMLVDIEDLTRYCAEPLGRLPSK